MDRAPDHKHCRYYLGLTYFAHNLPESDSKAIIQFTAAEDMPYPTALTILEYFLSGRSKLEEARSWFERCMEQYVWVPG